MKFDWKEAFTNWLTFLSDEDQLVVAINVSKDETSAKVKEWLDQWKRDHIINRTQITVLNINIPYDQPDFDGKGKAAALAACTQPYCILLDLDERLCPFMRDAWKTLVKELEYSSYEAFLIPSIDLCGDKNHYRCAGSYLGSKWYLHKNLPPLTRGVVNFARRSDGTWDRSKSDSCDLIHRDTGELAKTAHAVMSQIPHWMMVAQLESGTIPFVYHLGYLSFEQRIRQSEFWAPVWSARDPIAPKEIPITMQDLEKIPRFRHALPPWEVIS